MRKRESETELRDELWDLLGQGRKPQAPEGFEQRVLRAAKAAEPTADTPEKWVEAIRGGFQAAMRPVIAVPVAASLILGGLVLAPALWPDAGESLRTAETNPAQPAAPGDLMKLSDEGSGRLIASLDDQQFELILALDNYLEGERQDLWTSESDTALY